MPDALHFPRRPRAIAPAGTAPLQDPQRTRQAVPAGAPSFSPAAVHPFRSMVVRMLRTAAGPLSGVWAAWGRCMPPATRAALAVLVAASVAAVAVVSLTPSAVITLGGSRTAPADIHSPPGPPPGGPMEAP